MMRLATASGRCGYRKITLLLQIEGWKVNHKRVERLLREEALQLPHSHKKRKRLYHKDSYVIRLRPHYKYHISSINFVDDKLAKGRATKCGRSLITTPENHFVFLSGQQWMPMMFCTSCLNWSLSAESQSAFALITALCSLLNIFKLGSEIWAMNQSRFIQDHLGKTDIANASMARYGTKFLMQSGLALSIKHKLQSMFGFVNTITLGLIMD